ncbi:hypothetical protein FC09_GL000760 [Lactobacillus delbrueckii subsp. indicus DSM 15996]|nr:hypothetical protein FC09_GL000760 [Lactobacillus delbrueckii subsp. indicus DSM 15996]
MILAKIRPKSNYYMTDFYMTDFAGLYFYILSGPCVIMELAKTQFTGLPVSRP